MRENIIKKIERVMLVDDAITFEYKDKYDPNSLIKGSNGR